MEGAHNISEIFIFIKYQNTTYVIKLIEFKICFDCGYPLKHKQNNVWTSTLSLLLSLQKSKVRQSLQLIISAVIQNAPPTLHLSHALQLTLSPQQHGVRVHAL
jgi:hypothetical protein